MNVIFLDIDGELTYQNYTNKDTCNIDIMCVERLKKIIDMTGAVVVLSSTWKYAKGKDSSYDILKKILADYGITIHSHTPNIPAKFDIVNIFDENTKPIHGTGVAAEVDTWIKENHPDSYVILDDLDYYWSDYGMDKNWIQPCWFGDGGLKDEHVELAIQILSRKMV